MLSNFKIDKVFGIDPDIDRPGLSVYSRSKDKLIYCQAIPNWQLLENLDKVAPGSAVFYIDGGWLNNGFHHTDSLPANFKEYSLESKLAYFFKLGTQVGRNFGAGQILQQLLEHKHSVDNVYIIRPQAKNPKWTAEDLRRYTGWEYRTNQDARDAAKLCFKR